MFCKKVLALLVWCHCYQIVLNPFLHLLATSLYYSPLGFSQNIQDSFIHRYSHSNLVVTGSPIIVEANQVALTPGHEIILSCNLPEYPRQEFTWHRSKLIPNKYSTLPEETMKSEKDRYIIQDNSLILKKPNYNDVGDYICRVKDPAEGVETEKKIIVRARPYIQDFELEGATYRSAVIEEGSSLKIICNVIDEYVPLTDINVKWTMSKFEETATDEIVDGDQGIRFESYNTTSNALIIDKVTKDHRSFFRCHASNGLTDNSKVIFIRVKDKYTFIWPSLGILFELIILLVVIFVVENRKVEPDKEVYDHKTAHM